MSDAKSVDLAVIRDDAANMAETVALRGDVCLHLQVDDAHDLANFVATVSVMADEIEALRVERDNALAKISACRDALRWERSDEAIMTAIRRVIEER